MIIWCIQTRFIIIICYLFYVKLFGIWVHYTVYTGIWYTYCIQYTYPTIYINVWIMWRKKKCPYANIYVYYVKGVGTSAFTQYRAHCTHTHSKWHISFCVYGKKYINTNYKLAIVWKMHCTAVQCRNEFHMKTALNCIRLFFNRANRHTLYIYILNWQKLLLIKHRVSCVCRRRRRRKVRISILSDIICRKLTPVFCHMAPLNGVIFLVYRI